MRQIKKGATSQSVYVEILDSASTTGGRKTGIVYTGPTAYYVRNGGSAVAITLATLAAANSAWSSGGFKEVDATNMPGIYRLDVPDAALASGAETVVITIKGASGGAQVSLAVQLIDNTPADIYSRLGAPAGASTAADIAAVKTDTAAVKTKTDSLTFTVANQIDSNVLDWKGAAAPAMTGDAFARLGAPAGASVSADMAAVKGVLPAALVSGRIDAHMGSVADAVITAAKFAANALDAVWSTTTRLLSAGTNIVLAKGTGVTGLNDLDAAGVRTAVGLASANLDTQLDALPTNAELTTALGTADDAVLAAIAALNNLSAAGVRTAVGLASANLDTQLDALPTNAELATALAGADDAVLAAIAALNNLSAAGVRSAVGLASANLDTQLAALAAFIDTEIAAIIATLGAAGAGLTALPWNAAWDAEVQSEAADALNAYDPPTRAEATADKDAILTVLGTPADTDLATDISNISGGGGGPSAADIADAVWDEAIAGHAGAGSTGEALGAAGSAGDPWMTALPGAYSAGQAGKIIGDNLNATVSSRAAASALATVQTGIDDLPTNAELATALAAADDAVLAAIAALNNLSQANIRSAVGLATGNLDTQLGGIKGRTDNLPDDPADESLVIAATNSLASAIAALNNLSAAGVRAALGMASANLDTQLGDLPTNAELAIALGTADDVVLAAIAALNNLSQANVRAALGLASANLDALLDVLPTSSELAAALDASDDALMALLALVKAKTDALVFGVTGAVNANIEYVNGIAVAGTGAPSDQWGPA